MNLGPADLPKDSGRFDLPIALGILSAQGLLDDVALAQHEFAGELSLSGELRPVRGALAMGLAMHAAKAGKRLVLPPVSAQEAALVPTTEVYSAQHLQDAAARFAKPGEALFAQGLPASATSEGWQRVQAPNFIHAIATRSSHLDLSDFKGQATPKRVLEIAATVQHSFRQFVK